MEERLGSIATTATTATYPSFVLVTHKAAWEARRRTTWPARASNDKEGSGRWSTFCCAFV